ncbi:MAG: C39 family peptidase [Terriglobia bacterium]
MRRLVALIAALGVAMACFAATRAGGGLWLDVPYVRQPKAGCGAACIAMVIAYWRRNDPRFHAQPPDVGAIQHALYLPRVRGIAAADMESYLRRHGMRVFAFRGDWNLLREHLLQGRPLIVCLREGSDLHYVVVAGLDAANNVILVNDPAARKLEPLSRSAFERKWRARNDWTLLALPQP